MSAYIRCPKCNDETLDVDNLDCSECGYNVHSEAAALRAEVERLTRERDDALRSESERGELLAAATRALARRRSRAETAEAELDRMRPVVEAAEELWNVTVVAGDDAAVASEALMKFGESVDVFRRVSAGGNSNDGGRH